MPSEATAARAASSLRLLGDPTRMKLLFALSKGRSNVGRLAELAGASPTAASQHLAKLRLAGLVSARREGSYVYYALADDHVTRLVTDALEHASHEASLDGRAPGHPGGPERFAPRRPGTPQ